MDLSRGQRQDLSRPPRNLFFGAEDLKTNGPDGTADKMFPVRRSQRFRLSEQVIEQANAMAAAVRMLRAFDKTGNAGLALDHIEDTFTDLGKLVRNLVAEVEASEERWQQSVSSSPAVVDEPELAADVPLLSPVEGGGSGEAAPRVTPLVMAKAFESSIKSALDHVERRHARG